MGDISPSVLQQIVSPTHHSKDKINLREKKFFLPVGYVAPPQKEFLRKLRQ